MLEENKGKNTFEVVENVWSESTLVSHITGVLSVFGLDNGLEVVVGLGAHLHRLCETAGSCWIIGVQYNRLKWIYQPCSQRWSSRN